MRDRSPVQIAAALVGAVFLIVGIAGFIPGITTNLYDGLEFAGHDGNAELLGLFQVSILHNLVHLALGVTGLVTAATWAGARAYLLGGGIIYLGLGVYGFIIDRDSSANFVPVNMADNWLHVVLGGGMVVLGVLLGREYVARERIAERRI
jgi:hypothetical protein